MKRISILILIITSFSLFGQEESYDKQIVETDFGFHYINSNNNCNYIIDFVGDSLKVYNDGTVLEIDGKIITVTDFPITNEFYKSDSLDYKKLLVKYCDNEKEYFEKELYKSKLKITKEFYKNKEGKDFLLWTYKIPEDFKNRLQKKEMTSAYGGAHIFFISNNVVVGIYISSNNQEEFDNYLLYLKNTSNNIDVFGGPMNLYAWRYKIESMQKNKPFTYVDTIYNYKINIPYWFNVTQTNLEGVFSGTIPDINNVKNAIFIQSFKKSLFKSFADFNNTYILGNKFGQVSLYNNNHKWMGQKELTPPDGCNGLAYKVYILSGNFLYDCKYITYETTSSYILLSFTATRETYNKNISKFEEFVKAFQIE